MNHPKEICEGCIVGKQTRLPFKSGKTWRASTFLELVHTDIFGPMPESYGGNKNFITFIYYYTRKLWVSFFREKSAAFSIFKKWKAMVERESGHKLKILRSDRGGEYTSNIFKSYCSEEGIRQQFTAAYSPQQNGIAERKNRTILDMTRSMLKEKELPKLFWAEAVACAAYLINRSPTKSLKHMTPQEAWSRHKPSVGHLKIFGCIAYSQVPKEKRKKLDDRGEKNIFIGYSEQSKAYKLYNPVTRRMVISRDVIFDENASWNWSTQEEGQSKKLMDEVIEDKENIHIPDNQPVPSPTHSTSTPQILTSPSRN